MTGVKAMKWTTSNIEMHSPLGVMVVIPATT